MNNEIRSATYFYERHPITAQLILARCLVPAFGGAG